MQLPPTPTPAASFVLAPVEERLADALAGRYDVLAACASACRASATISVSGRTARRLDLGRKAMSIGGGSKRRGSPGTAELSVHLGLAGAPGLESLPERAADQVGGVEEGGRDRRDRHQVDGAPRQEAPEKQVERRTDERQRRDPEEGGLFLWRAGTAASS